MTNEDFRNGLLACFDQFRQVLTTATGDWAIKGFLDVYRNIYTISVDTKVVSKIIELMLFPVISRFARRTNCQIVLSEHQNHYPDITFVTPAGGKLALDIKSAYRTSQTTVSGFTLGAFTGYFRQRMSSKNATYPYGEYAAHFVLGVIYSRSAEAVDEQRVYQLDELQDIVSVVRDFDLLVHEKWRLAGERPGSGNTKNIGSSKDIVALKAGKGPFAEHGEAVFDDYWMNYLTEDMARMIDSEVPYRDLAGYWRWRDRGVSGG